MIDGRTAEEIAQSLARRLPYRNLLIVSGPAMRVTFRPAATFHVDHDQGTFDVDVPLDVLDDLLAALRRVGRSTLSPHMPGFSIEVTDPPRTAAEGR